MVGSCTSTRSIIDDACASVTCPDGQQCVDGTCVLADTVVECVEDVDCAQDWLCDDGVCTPTTPEDPCESMTCEEGEECVEGVCVTDWDPADGIASVNATVDFANLFVGQVYEIVAPDPTPPVEVGDGATDGTLAGETDGTDGGTGTEAFSSIVRADPVYCACEWTTVPEAAASFDPVDGCDTEMTPAQDGEFEIAVAVTCGETEAQFLQIAFAQTPPTPCTDNDDCQGDEVCLESVCAARTGPVMTVLGERHRSPYLMVFDLRLEDRDGLPIHDGIVSQQFRILENGVEVDSAETEYLVMPAPNLPLRVVLVLDYTVSMDQAGAISEMVSAARRFIEGDHFTATHHVGVVEFHDRTAEGEGFDTVAPLTRMDEEGKAAVSAALPEEGTLEAGLSRVWDAVNRAIDLLGESDRQPGEVQAVVFLSDGEDTTSETLPAVLLSSAIGNDIKLYPIGFGHVSPNETLLQSFADQTGGAYFQAGEAGALSDVFSEIARDLRGQWTLSYVTQKNDGTVKVRVEFDYDRATDSFMSDVNVGSLDGDIHAVVVEAADRRYEETTNVTSFLLKAEYVPRNINRMRFFVAHDGSTFTLQGAGGLTPVDDGWVIIPTDGMYYLVGSEPLAYGSFGNVGVITVPGDVAQLQIVHDDSIYSTLPQPKTVVFEGDDRLSPALLTTVVDPVAGGVVSVDPDKFAYELGETVSLVASASGNHVFAGWSGDATGSDYTTTVTMDKDKAVTAGFYPPRTLTVTVSPAGSGAVTAVPAKVTYRHGEIVVLTATPVGSTFSAWSGSVTGTDTTVTVTMDSDKEVTATFTVSQ